MCGVHCSSPLPPLTVNQMRKMEATLKRKPFPLLRKWASRFRIPNVHKLTKPQLIYNLRYAYSSNCKTGTESLQQALDLASKSGFWFAASKQVMAAQKIQRFFRRYVKGSQNHQDFVTLESFPRGLRLFRHIISSDHNYRFVPTSLAQHLVTSGVWNNPYTGHEFTLVELSRLTRMVKQQDPNWKIDLVKDASQLKRAAKEAQNLECNIEMFEDLVKDVMQRGVFDQKAVVGVMVDEDMLEWMIMQWRVLEQLRNEYLSVLFRLSSARADMLVDELCAQLLELQGCEYFSHWFRVYITVVEENLKTAYQQMKYPGPANIFMPLVPVAVNGVPVNLPEVFYDASGFPHFENEMDNYMDEDDDEDNNNNTISMDADE